MGGTISTPQRSKACMDHGGTYTVTRKNDRLIFSWGNKHCGVDVEVGREKEAVAASLVRHTIGKDKKKHYDVKRDGHLDVLIEEQTVRIHDSRKRNYAYGSTALARVVFAALRVYASNVGQQIKSAIVEISSTRAKSVYHCYVKAFRKNGFTTVEKEPSTKKVQGFLLIFTRYVYQQPKLCR